MFVSFCISHFSRLKGWLQSTTISITNVLQGYVERACRNCIPGTLLTVYLNGNLSNFMSRIRL